MLSNIFLGMSLLGAEWVLYLLLILSIFSVALVLERVRFYQAAGKGLAEFRQKLRQAAGAGNWDEAMRLAQSRGQGPSPTDLESGVALALIQHKKVAAGKTTPDVLSEVGQDAILRNRLNWDKNLGLLATIGSNAPFIGLFGTVLGIIKAFHDLSRQAGAGAQTVTAGISEALIATAVGILVAIPAVVAFNLCQRRVRMAITEAEALKSFLIGKMAE